MVSLMMQSSISDNADPINLGFGPEMKTAATSAGGGLAGPTISPGVPPVYLPQLQTNNGNATSGDVVSGNYGPDQPGVEQSDYTRNDFSPAASSSSGTNPPPSMLVRMHRVAPGNSLDAQSGISSSGDAVPYLFAYGAGVDRNTVARGVTVRGTSVASIGFNPANNPQISSNDPSFTTYPTIGMVSSAGWANPSANQIGVVPIAIYSDPAGGIDGWSPLVASQAQATLSVANDGSTLQNSSGQTIGFLLNQSTWMVTAGQSTSLAPVIIGQTASPDASALPPNQSSAFIVLLSAAHQVIGFGAADGLTAGNRSISFTPVQNRVAWENASAMVVQPLAQGVDVQSLWTLRTAVQYPLFAPVLVNR